MKKFITGFTVLIFIAAALLSVLLIIKPGASIFHLRRTLSSADIRHLDGHAYFIPVNINTRLFPPAGILLYEGDQLLTRSFTAHVKETGNGNYALVEKVVGEYDLVFSPLNNADPGDGDKQYTILLKPAFFNRAAGFSFLFILGLGLAWFLIYVYRRSDQGTSLLSNPMRILQLLSEFIGDEIPRTIRAIPFSHPINQPRSAIWMVLFYLTIGASFFYVLMEWIFFVTKHSFMDLMGWPQKTGILLVSSFGLLLTSLLILLLLALIDWLASRLRPTWIMLFLGTLVPTVILTAVSLILLDNFTYTILGFGIVSTSGFSRFIYGFGFLVVFILLNRWIQGLLGLRGEMDTTYPVPRILSLVLIGLLLISAVTTGIIFINGFRNTDIQMNEFLNEPLADSSKPNIILIGSDGLNASNMSAYGYQRDTTPVLKDLAKTSLVAENAFANASNSAGSVISILTGKSPAQTRVLYPPNILEGSNSVQHLPGILRDAGYRAIELGVPHYVDAFQANLLDGFNKVNGREIDENPGIRIARRLGLGNFLYFTSEMADRIIERMLHIFLIEEMGNPFADVTQTTDIKHDREQLEQLITLVKDADEPLFIHVHLMGTHGPRFSPSDRQFSIGKSQDEDWDVDFYDDTIRNFDSYVEDLLSALQQIGEFDSTIFIIYSDHPMQFNVRWRMPLIFHFPEDAHAGRIENNVQNLDIAPTILDYLNIPEPGWMEGQSLLGKDFEGHDLIFSTGTSQVVRSEQRRWVIESSQVKPPFFQFSFFNIINCNNWYWYDFSSQTWDSGTIPGHTRSCSEDEFRTMQEIEAAFIAYLNSNGFDTSTLPFQ